MPGLDRSRNLLDLLRQRLYGGTGAAADPLIESVVVNYLLTVIYADLEIAIRETFEAYAAKGEDARTNAFLRVAIKRLIRSMKCNELSGVLGMFDEDCKKHFQTQVNDKPEQGAYDRIIAGRHEQSHALGSVMTLQELAGDLEHCQTILSFVAEALECSCRHGAT